MTVSDVLANTVASSGDQIALRVQRVGRWVEWTWNEYYGESCKFAKGCIAAGSTAPHTVSAFSGRPRTDHALTVCCFMHLQGCSHMMW